jgi:macrolide transport system ATP-binding/permease protein
VPEHHTTPVIELTGLTKRFGSDPPVDALIDANLRVQRGDWLAVVGPSGSGKSTLLNLVGCLDVATSGSYRFDGIEVADLDDRERSALRGRSIGFVFQSFHLLSYRSVTDNVMLSDIYRRAPRSGRRDGAQAVLDQVGLAHRADYFPTRLSGGERQRVAIARALMGSPRLLLCDEPTGNLDSATTANILELLVTLNAHGMTIIMITHDHNVAQRAGRKIHIVDGRLAEEP